jgi:hypothetical protein
MAVIETMPKEISLMRRINCRAVHPIRLLRRNQGLGHQIKRKNLMLIKPKKK